MNFLNFFKGPKPKFIVEAKVIRACPNCGQSGVTQSDPNYKYSDTCSNCGEKRPDVENLGVIYQSDEWWHFKKRIKDLFQW